MMVCQFLSLGQGDLVLYSLRMPGSSKKKTGLAQWQMGAKVHQPCCVHSDI